MEQVWTTFRIRTPWNDGFWDERSNDMLLPDQTASWVFPEDSEGKESG